MKNIVELPMKLIVSENLFIMHLKKINVFHTLVNQSSPSVI